MDAAGTLKITDFGLAAVYKLVETGKTRALTERCGTLPYVAPEVCLTGPSIDLSHNIRQLNTDNPYQAEPVDVWGVGVILFTLLLGSELRISTN